jgi:GntR family transcriptional regulator
MKLWLSRTSSVPLQQQLRTQLMLGIVSGDLSPGEKLPSTPEIARRFRVHANTVRAAYRDLVKGQWAEWRPGSGFYVSARPASRPGADELDRMIFMFLEMAESGGYAIEEIRRRIEDRIAERPPDHVLIVEPDPDLREILVAEIRAGTGARAEGAGIDASLTNDRLTGALVAVLPDHLDAARAALPPGAQIVALSSRSIAANLAGQTRPSRDTSVTVVSAWADFRRWAEIILTGVGLDPMAFDLRDSRHKGWDRGLTRHSFIIADSLTAARLPADCKPRVFALVSDQSILELRQRLGARAETG